MEQRRPSNIRFTVQSAKGRALRKFSQSLNPYVQVLVDGYRYWQTNIVKETCEPAWLQSFDLLASEETIISIRLYDTNGDSKEDSTFLGSASFNLGNVIESLEAFTYVRYDVILSNLNECVDEDYLFVSIALANQLVSKVEVLVEHDAHGQHFQKGDLVDVVSCSQNGVWKGLFRGDVVSLEAEKFGIAAFSSETDNCSNGSSEEAKGGVKALLPPSILQAQAITGYLPSNPDELRFNEGSFITLLEYVNAETWRGACWGRRGLVSVKHLSTLQRVRAAVDYSPSSFDPVRLAFSRGDILTLLAPADQRMWKADLRGKKGLVPIHYLFALERAKAICGFHTSEPGELQFDKGDVITVLSRTEGWWAGLLHGRAGYFLKDYVAMIEEPADPEELRWRSSTVGQLYKAEPEPSSEIPTLDDEKFAVLSDDPAATAWPTAREKDGHELRSAPAYYPEETLLIMFATPEYYMSHRPYGFPRLDDEKFIVLPDDPGAKILSTPTVSASTTRVTPGSDELLEAVPRAESDRPVTNGPSDTQSKGSLDTQASATSKTYTPTDPPVKAPSPSLSSTKGDTMSKSGPSTPGETAGSGVPTEEDGLLAVARSLIPEPSTGVQPVTIGIDSPSGGVDSRLASFFTQNTRKSYTDAEILEISSLLKHTRNDVWSQVPRAYIVLRTIGHLNLLNEFISLGFTDHWFPVSLKQLPHSLSPTVRSEIVKMQSLVLTKSVELEKGNNGRHCHFARGEPVPFKVMGRLGTGGFGQVDRVLSLISYKEYALKRIRRQNLFGKGAVRATKYFIGEVEMLKRLQHRHAVEFIGSYTDHTYFAVIMSPVAEMDLAAYLENHSARKLPELRTFFGCLAHALDYLHSEQIRHKDVKPSNILLSQGNILLTDFGLARDFTDATGSTTSGATALSPRYCAPEVAQYEKRNTSADIWSLGCVFFEMFLVLKGQTINDMKAFFAQRGSREPYIRTNPQAFAEQLAELAGVGVSSDNRAIGWLKAMCQVPREARPTAATLVSDITAPTESDEHGRNFCGICCLEGEESDPNDSLDGFEDEVESWRSATPSASATHLE